MESLATTRLSSKGQVVIPEEIRERLGLKEGTQFVVIGERDVVILKSIAPPSMEEFDELVRSARGAARRRASPSRAVRVILDTNVFVSGAFFGGIPARILGAWRDARVQLVSRRAVEPQARKPIGRSDVTADALVKSLKRS